MSEQTGKTIQIISTTTLKLALSVCGFLIALAVYDLRDSIKEMKTDMGTMRIEMQDIRGDLKTINYELTTHEKAIDRLEHQKVDKK